jgi:hypothetical protein
VSHQLQQDDKEWVDPRRVLRTNATVITDAAKVASDEFTDWRVLANDKSTVSISWKNGYFWAANTHLVTFSPC